jgi:hypothetical protein
MTASVKAGSIGRLIPLAVALAVVLAAAGCASGPLGSHGVDYIPSFDSTPPNQ